MTAPKASLDAVARFSEAFGTREPDAVLATMTAAPLFESTAPPDGRRYEGRDAVRAAFEDFFRSSSDAQFVTEEQWECGDRVVVLWTYQWGNGHVRGVDVFRVENGLVAEKRSYVKG
jgi:ketosteroid isomerase-like protein